MCKIRESECAQRKAGKINSEWAAIQDLKATVINMFKELKEVMHKEIDEVDEVKKQMKQQKEISEFHK